ncbi:beta-lactamase family protein [Carboxylicivirga mesophila]|uniref:Beta-lactamase family protein n=1 Tax=Carboxylicivirga mesophila TaxID=1166478 RepID=A0ABS5K954_9BACT|nr:serine hydrolase domain-containing protein [Carboxylicivirga mesophila]MBS2211402.1 beta-lactamase family protein [Carboxylicivirga mesophila]
MKINLPLICMGIAMLTLWACNTSKNHQIYNDAQLDSLFIHAIEHHKIPGAVALVSYQDTIIYHKAFGCRNIDAQTRLLNNDIFRMASMTKALTAVAILQLQEKGLLNTSDYVYQYLPEFKSPRLLTKVLPDSSFRAIPAQSDITIHQLLTHTSGIAYGFQDDQYNALILKNNISEGFGHDTRTSRENIQKIAALPLLHEPDSAYTYGLSFDVLGVLIEEVSGQRYDEYITEHILKPCGMHDSYFIIPEQHRHRLPDVYEPADNDELQITSYADTNYPCLSNRQFFSGGADLCSTAKDYHSFLQMLSANGTFQGHQVLAPESVAAMLSKQTSLGEGDSYQGYAAWVTNALGAQNGLSNEGTYGFGGFFDTYCWTDPKANISAVLLLQMYPNNNHQIHEKFQKLTYELINQ